MIKVSKILTSAYQSWKSFIHGEWWLKETGETEYADGDSGDRGHEQIAVADVLSHYSDKFQMAFFTYFKKLQQEDPEAYQDELTSFSGLFHGGQDPEDFDFANDEGLDVLYYENGIPDEVGEAAMAPGMWHEFKQDIRLFYSKYFKAAHVINNSFSVYTLTSRMIDAIQGFILEQADENGIGEDEGSLPGSIHIEEVSTHHYSEIPCAEFLTMKYANQVFMVAGKSANKK